jgi:hypothetical protein
MPGNPFADGFAVCAWNAPAAPAPLADAGARLDSTPAAAAEAADVVSTMPSRVDRDRAGGHDRCREDRAVIARRLERPEQRSGWRLRALDAPFVAPDP